MMTHWLDELTPDEQRAFWRDLQSVQSTEGE